MKSNKKYYIVLRDDLPTELGEIHDEKGILLLGFGATLFVDRKKAQAAIRRTTKYASAFSYWWADKSRYRVGAATVAA